MSKGTLNKIILIGNIGADPESRETASNNTITTLRIATTERRKEGDEWTDATEWHRVTLFGRNAEVARDYCQKGQKVLIEGSMRTRKWQDKNGQDRYDYEIRVQDFQLMGGGKSEGQARPAQAQASRRGQPKREEPAEEAPAFDDEIPF